MLISRTACMLLGWVLVASTASAQDDVPAAPETDRFTLHAELKAHFRSSDAVEERDEFPFPPPFIPQGETAVFLRTPQEGSSLEVSTLNLIGEAHLSPNLEGRVEVHILDLHNRNPTSSDDRVQLREAWLRFGRKFEPLEAMPSGRSAYLLAGKAPRFTRPRLRRLESYGLWSTAIGRFEEVQVELGGSVGEHLYWRAQVANGNPLFMRDPNALAGDNGTPERVPGEPLPNPIFQSGFPILYDAKSNDLNASGEFQTGAGVGARFVDADGEGIDVLAWHFRRKLADTVPIRGSFYSGDLKLLQGPFFLFPLPIHGDSKRETGLNVSAKHGGLYVFGQFVDQEIAGLGRSGGEIELAWRAEIAGMLMGETPVFRYVQPVLRVSVIDNDFEAPRLYPNPAVAWDWRKYDLGVRVGVVPGVDVTLEYAHNDARARTRTLHPDELLITLRAAY